MATTSLVVHRGGADAEARRLAGQCERRCGPCPYQRPLGGGDARDVCRTESTECPGTSMWWLALAPGTRHVRRAACRRLRRQRQRGCGSRRQRWAESLVAAQAAPGRWSPSSPAGSTVTYAVENARHGPGPDGHGLWSEPLAGGPRSAVDDRARFGTGIHADIRAPRRAQWARCLHQPSRASRSSCRRRPSTAPDPGDRRSHHDVARPRFAWRHRAATTPRRVTIAAAGFVDAPSRASSSIRSTGDRRRRPRRHVNRWPWSHRFAASWWARRRNATPTPRVLRRQPLAGGIATIQRPLAASPGATPRREDLRRRRGPGRRTARADKAGT